LPKSSKHRILLSTESSGGVCVRSVAPSRLDQTCGLAVSFDLMTGRVALGRETVSSALAAFLLER
jgi:hypothetical protein